LQNAHPRYAVSIRRAPPRWPGPGCPTLTGCGSFARPLSGPFDGHSLRLDRTSPFLSEGGKVWNRRVSPIASGRGDGLLPDHRAGAQPQRQELVFMPRSRPSRPSRSAQVGGFRRSDSRETDQTVVKDAERSDGLLTRPGSTARCFASCRYQKIAYVVSHRLHLGELSLDGRHLTVAPGDGHGVLCISGTQARRPVCEADLRREGSNWRTGSSPALRCEKNISPSVTQVTLGRARGLLCLLKTGS
jgi:hypothetical protein